MSSPCAERRRRRAQRGVALITVMLVFVLATMMATEMLRTSYLGIRRTGNLVDSTQARYFALGAEELGRLILREDGKGAGTTGGGIDHLREPWAADNLSFEIEDGRIELQITDLSGRFNLNGVVDDKGRTDPVAVQRLGKLMRVLGLDPVLAEQIADRVDADNSTLRGSSESSAWGGTMPNQPLVEPDELRVLPGLDAEGWARLQPHVAALPPGTRLNVNTATAEVLEAFAARPGAAEVERFVHAREVQPIRDVNDPALAALFGDSRPALDVRSMQFQISAHAEFRERHARLATRVQRDPKTGEVGILGRSDAARL